MKLGGVILGFWLLLALFGACLPLPAADAQNLKIQFQGASAEHWLGTGENGVDLGAQLVAGARLSLAIAFSAVSLSAGIGLLLGSWAGYAGGRVDAFVMRLVDVVYAFPGLLLVVGLAAVLGPSPGNVVIALAATSWASYARLVRGNTLSLRERDYVQAARAAGAGGFRIVTRHLWPNLWPFLIIQMSYGLSGAILTESSLSFLGLGAPPGTPSWGQMLSSGREFMLTSTRLLWIPGVAILSLILGLNLLGDGLRDKLDPKTHRT